MESIGEYLISLLLPLEKGNLQITLWKVGAMSTVKYILHSFSAVFIFFFLGNKTPDS